MSVKIAFWGMEESCHITENMIVMSWLLAKIRPAHSIFVHRENGWQCIFSGGKDRILFADCGCGRDKKTQNSLKNADVIVAGSIPIRMNGRRSYTILQSDTKRFFIWSKAMHCMQAG